MTDDSIEYEPDFDFEEDIPSNAQDENLNNDHIPDVKIFAQTHESALMGSHSSKQSEIKEAIEAVKEMNSEIEKGSKIPPPIVELQQKPSKPPPVKMPPVKVGEAQQIQQRTQLQIQQQQRPQSSKVGARIQRIAANRTQYTNNERSSSIMANRTAKQEGNQPQPKKWVQPPAPKPQRHPSTTKQSIQANRQSLQSKQSTKPSTAYQNIQSQSRGSTETTGVRLRLHDAIKLATPNSRHALPNSTRQTVQSTGHYFPSSSRALGQSQSRKSVQQRPQKHLMQAVQKSRPQSGVRPIQHKVQTTMVRSTGIGVDQSFDRYGAGRSDLYFGAAGGGQSTRSLQMSTSKILTSKALESPSLKNSVSKMRISDYYGQGALKSSAKEEERLAPIDLLDKIITVEENIYGRDLPYNKGKDLFSGLLNVDRLSEFVQSYGKDPLIAKFERVNKDIQPYIDPFKVQNPDDQQALVPYHDKDQDWTKLMDFFQANPAALLDAIPTPRGEEEAPQTLRSSRSSRSLGPENKFGASLKGGSRLQSPKAGGSIVKRKFSGLHNSSSRQSLNGGLSQSFAGHNRRPITPKRQVTEKKEFRISRTSGFGASSTTGFNRQNPNKTTSNNASHLRAKRQELEQKHNQQVQQRRQQKQKIKASMDTVPLPKKIISDLDWKDTPLYKDYIDVQGAAEVPNPKQPFEMDANLFREDEIEYLKNMIKLNQQGNGKGLTSLCNPLITKGQSTILFILKEVLGQHHYANESDSLVVSLTSGDCDLAQKTLSILDKIQGLFKLRDQVINFLKLINKREKILYDMKQQVMKIEKDQDLDSERGNKEFRIKIQQLGKELEMTTAFLNKEVKKFLVTVNRGMTQIKIDKFIFDGADYLKICEKEMKEISEIFETFDLVTE